MKRQKVSNSTIDKWAFLPSALVWALLPARLGKLADRFGRKLLMLTGLGAAALSSFIIPALGSVVLLAALWAFLKIPKEKICCEPDASQIRIKAKD